MGKLIHCKDDLDKKEEIQARRIKDMLLKNNPKIVETPQTYHNKRFHNVLLTN